LKLFSLVTCVDTAATSRVTDRSRDKNRSTRSRLRNGHCFRRIFRGKLVKIIYHVSLSDSHYQPHNVRYYHIYSYEYHIYITIYIQYYWHFACWRSPAPCAMRSPAWETHWTLHRVAEKSKPKCFCHIFHKPWLILLKSDIVLQINLPQSTVNFLYLT